jgi:hypothetical protein
MAAKETSRRLKARPYGRMAFTLALSFFVICATNQCSGFVTDGLWKAIALLVFSLLIFFVVKYTPRLVELIAASIAHYISLKNGRHMFYAVSLCRHTLFGLIEENWQRQQGSKSAYSQP